MRDAILRFELDTSRIPSAREGFNVLFKRPRDVAQWNGPYVAGHVPLDPWGHAYRYSLGSSGHFRVISNGPDGRTGGKAGLDDIVASG